MYVCTYVYILLRENKKLFKGNHTTISVVYIFEVKYSKTINTNEHFIKNLLNKCTPGVHIGIKFVYSGNKLKSQWLTILNIYFSLRLHVHCRSTVAMFMLPSP